MTLRDLFKIVGLDDLDKMMILRDENDGWSNIMISIDHKRDEIVIKPDRGPIFSDEK